MPKESSIENVFGKGLGEEGKKAVLGQVKEYFGDQKIEELEDKEREKSETEKEIIALVNKETNKLLEKYGLPPFDVPEKNVHVLDEEEWEKTEENIDHEAYFMASSQHIGICGSEINLIFAERCLHEMIHFKSYAALQVQEGQNCKKEDEEVSLYRLGLEAYKRRGEEVYFNNLNEGLTEELTRKFISSLKEHPLFRKDFEETAETEKQYKKRYPHFFNSDTYCAKVVEFSNSEKVVRVGEFSQDNQRKVLNILIDKICQKNKDNELKNREKVFDMFARAMFTGNLLPLGRLIDKTFGKGTFRRIGELDNDVEKQKTFVKKL